MRGVDGSGRGVSVGDKWGRAADSCNPVKRLYSLTCFAEHFPTQGQAVRFAQLFAVVRTRITAVELDNRPTGQPHQTRCPGVYTLVTDCQSFRGRSPLLCCRRGLSLVLQCMRTDSTISTYERHRPMP